MGRLVFVVVLVAALGFAEAAYHFGRYLLERRHDDLRRRLRTVGLPDAGVVLLRSRRPGRGDSGDGETAEARLATLLEQADLDWTAARFFLYTGAAGVLALAASTLLVGSVLLALPSAALVASAPLLFVLRKRSARSRSVSEQLPDALEMMARSIRAGHALPSSFRLVAQEMPPPIAVEFGKAFEQQNLGLPFDQAVAAMTARVPGNGDVGIFAVSVLIQRETGGNLVENLEKIAEMIRERERFYGKLRALTAEGRMGGYILGSLPFVVAMMLTAINRDYMAELSTPGLGRMFLTVGAVAWSVGVLWMRALAQVEF